MGDPRKRHDPGFGELLEIAAASQYDPDEQVKRLKKAKDARAFVRAIRSAIAWLDAEQAENAIVHHLGIHCPHVFLVGREAVKIDITPDSVLVVELLLKYDERKGHGGDDRWRGFSEDDWATVQQLVASVATVVDSWNGARCDSGSFRVSATAGPDLRRARKNYDSLVCNDEAMQRACAAQKAKRFDKEKVTEDQIKFQIKCLSCLRKPDPSGVFCECQVRRDGYDALRRPRGWS